MNTFDATAKAMNGKKTKLIFPAEVGIHAHFWKPLLTKLLEKHSFGERNADHVEQELKEGKCQLWVHLSNSDQIKSCAITRIEVFPLKKRLVFDFCFGSKIRHWLKEIEEPIVWAKALGCDEVVALCRPGLAKLLTDDAGFKRAYDVVIRRI